MRALKLFAIPFLILLAATSKAQTTRDDSARMDKISQKMVALNKKLVPGVTAVNMNWGENKEVIEIKSWPTLKRIAAIRNIIWDLQENERKFFPNFDKDQNQLAAGLIGRVFAYNFLKEFIRDSVDEIGMKDYLDGEIADLNLTLNHKLPYGMYAAERKRREDKLGGFKAEVQRVDDDAERSRRTLA